MQRTRPDILVKSDAAQEITKAVEEFGWHGTVFSEQVAPQHGA